MSWIENLLIVAGIGLDIFAAMEIQGAMLAQVRKKTLAIVVAVVVILQLTFYLGGYAVFKLLAYYKYLEHPVSYGEIIAVIVCALLGIRLIVKAIRREFVQEHRADSVKVFDYIRIVTAACLYALSAGAVCGLVGTTVWQLALIILIVSVVVVIGGVYTGFHFGFEIKTKAYVIGAVLLWIAGAEILLTSVFHVI